MSFEAHQLVFCCYKVCIAWTHLRHTSFELAVHVGMKSVAPSSQPEQDDLLWSVQFVKAVRLIRVWVLLLPLFLGERFDDSLFIHWSHLQCLMVVLFKLCACVVSLKYDPESHMKTTFLLFNPRSILYCGISSSIFAYISFINKAPCSLQLTVIYQYHI